MQMQLIGRAFRNLFNNVEEVKLIKRINDLRGENLFTSTSKEDFFKNVKKYKNELKQINKNLGNIQRMNNNGKFDSDSLLYLKVYDDSDLDNLVRGNIDDCILITDIITGYIVKVNDKFKQRININESNELKDDTVCRFVGKKNSICYKYNICFCGISNIKNKDLYIKNIYVIRDYLDEPMYLMWELKDEPNLNQTYSDVIKSENYLMNLIHDIKENIIRLDSDNNVKFCTGSFAEFLGNDLDCILGDNLKNVLATNENNLLLYNKIENVFNLLDSENDRFSFTDFYYINDKKIKVKIIQRKSYNGSKDPLYKQIVFIDTNG